MKKLIGILIYLIGFSCCENKFVPDYPAIIERNNLQDLYDKAKWEIYKLNTIKVTESNIDYLVSFGGNDSLLMSFYKKIGEYQKRGDNLSEDKEELIKFFGHENVKEFLNAELELFDNDSSEIYKEEEIYLSFFPKNEKGKYWQSPSLKICYAIVFKNEEIIRAGCNDYYEFEYPIGLQKSSDIKFLKLIAKKKNLNDWLTWYKNNKYKSQLN